MVELTEFIKEGDEAQEKVCPASHVMFTTRVHPTILVEILH